MHKVPLAIRYLDSMLYLMDERLHAAFDFDEFVVDLSTDAAQLVRTARTQRHMRRFLR